MRSSVESGRPSCVRSLTTDQLVEVSTDVVTLATLLFSSTDLPTPAEFAVRQRRSFPDWSDDELERATVGIIAAWQVLPMVVRLYYVYVEPTEEDPVDDVWSLDGDFLDRLRRGQSTPLRPSLTTQLVWQWQRLPNSWCS